MTCDYVAKRMQQLETVVIYCGLAKNQNSTQFF